MFKFLFKLIESGTLTNVVGILLQNKFNEFKSAAIKKIAHIISSFVMMIVVSLVFLIMFLFLGLGVSIFLNQYLNSSYLGFLIVGGFFFVIGLLLLNSIRRGTIQRLIEAQFKHIMEKNHHED
jgi:hypothetical protein